MATSFKQRRALGKRYAQDPALQLERDKLQYQYSLAPGREALAEQKAQYNQTLAFNREQAALNRAAQKEAEDAAAVSSMVGTAANLGTTVGLVNVARGKSFFSNPFSPNKTTAQPVATQTPQTATGIIKQINPATADAAATVGTGVTYGPAAEGLGPYQFGPGGLAAEIDAYGATLPAVATDSIAPAASVQTETAADAATSLTAGTAMKTVGAAGLGYGVGSVTKDVTGSKGGGAIAGTVTGAVTGFAAGGPVGAVIGAIAGFVGGASWLCTKTKELVGFNVTEWETIGEFREYARKTHADWLGWYVDIGNELLEAIDGDKEYYENLKSWFLLPVIFLTHGGHLEAAFEAYRAVVIDLVKQHKPELMKTAPEEK